jgi:GR25 family glycosyltransferase involved in LPS biosynthesis
MKYVMRYFVILFPLFCSTNLISTNSIYQAYVINLPKRPERLASIAGQLDKEGIPYVVQNAISPEDIEAEVLARRNNEPSPGAFDPETKMNFTTGIFPKLRQTELGCFQSHVQALIKISKSKSNDPVLILEDDANLASDFYARTNDLLSNLPENWDVFQVGYCGTAKCRIEKGPKKEGFCKSRKAPLLCTHGYFVNGSKAAKILLNTLNTPAPAGILDFVLFKTTPNYYASVPKLATQIFEFGSDNGNGKSAWRSE